jgi:small subunit ribosomal protein S6
MQYYESIYILNPDLSSEESQKIQETLSEVVRKEGGEIHVVDDWGVKRLAYEVKKHNRGHYVLMQFASKADTLRELERNYRVNDGVIKYMTLRIEESGLQPAPPEKSEPEPEATQPEAEAAQPEPEAAKPEAEASKTEPETPDKNETGE